MLSDGQAKYWLDLAKEDLDVAQVLLTNGKLLHFGFMCHLVAEKALKAKIEHTGGTAPKIHNLIRLAELGGILDILSEAQSELLATLNPLQIEARYPAYKQQIELILTPDKCNLIFNQTKGVADMDRTTALKNAILYAEEVRKVLTPYSIVLYGSFAKDSAAEDSDIDIAVIFDGYTGDWLKDSALLWQLTRNVSTVIEPILLDRTQDPSGFVEEVMGTGEILYRAAA